VTDPESPGAPLPVRQDLLLGTQVVDLPERNWPMAENLDRLDRFPVVIENPGNAEAAVPVVFALEGSFQGVTGMCPVLRDAEGNPSGIPVQISKNWHRDEKTRLLYEGAWFHAVTQVPVPPGGKWEGELAIAYARWGGLFLDLVHRGAKGFEGGGGFLGGGLEAAHFGAQRGEFGGPLLEPDQQEA